MRTRSSSNLPVVSPPNPSTSNPKRRNRRRLKQPFVLEESPIDTMADQRTLVELLRAPTEGYAEAIVVPMILAEQFELKHSLINMMTSDQFFGLEKDNPHDHIRWFNKITSAIKYKDVPNSPIKLMLFPFSLAGAARRWLEKEPPHSILTWEDLVSKFINELFPPSRTTNLRNEISNFQQRFDESFHEAWDRCKDLLRDCPHHGFTELHQLDTFYNALNPADQDSLNSAAGGNLLERHTQDVLTIIKTNLRSAILETNRLFINVVTTAMTAILKQFQATPPLASVKAVEKICVTCGGAHPYYQCLAAGGNTFPELRDNIQGYVAAAAVNYNQGNSVYRPLALLSNKEKLQELANTPLNENCSAVILKKLPEKLGNPGKFLIPCGSDFLEDQFSTNQPSGNPTFSSHPELTSTEVKDDMFYPEGGNVLHEKLLDIDSTKDLYSPHHFDIESDLKEIEYLLHYDPIKDIDSILKDSIDQSNLADLNNNLVDYMPKMFTDEHGLDYSSPPIFDEYDGDLFKVESDTENFHDDPFDSNGEKIKESKLLIDELDLPSDSCKTRMKIPLNLKFL
nr:reverse transcriptase domain-containing protein [Tanacetum cinerariifolium]